MTAAITTRLPLLPSAKKAKWSAVAVVLSTLLAVIMPGQALGQAAQEVFGKSRLQYRTFKWQYLSSSNFDVYYYTDSTAMARTAARYAEAEFTRISDLMGFSPYNKIRIYLYQSRAHMLQSNVGLEEDNNGMGGRTTFAKNLVEIAYPGSQVQFRQQIAEGIASKLIYDMLYGGSLKEAVQSNYLLTLPDWFMAGVVRYASRGWDQRVDNQIRHEFEQGLNRIPSNLLEERAAIIGHSIWAYIAQRYGNQAVSNVLNQTRLQRDEQESILMSLGVPYSKFVRDWRTWCQTQTDHVLQYATPLGDPTVIASLGIEESPHQLTVSTTGRFVAWTENFQGRYQVWVYDTVSKSSSIWLRGGYEVLNQKPDLQTPLLAWQGDDVLHVIQNKRGQVRWVQLNIQTRESKAEYLDNIQQVNSLAVRSMKTGTFLLMSVDREARTDLAVLQVGKVAPTFLTNDLWDDADAAWLGDTAIVFSSNRPNDSLSIRGSTDRIGNSYDLWVFRLPAAKPGAKVLRRLTKTWWSESRPMPAANGRIYYVENPGGIARLAEWLPAGNTRPLSDLAYDLEAVSVVNASQPWYAITLWQGRRRLIQMPPLDIMEPAHNWETDRSERLKSSLLRQAIPVIGEEAVDQAYLAGAETVATPRIKKVAEPEQALTVSKRKWRPLKSDTLAPGDIDIRNYQFELERNEPRTTDKPAPKPVPVTKAKQGLDAILQAARQVQFEDKALAFGPFLYENRMNITSVSTGLEINPLAGWGLHLQSNMSDLFENHKFVAGGTIFGDFTSNFIFGEYQYLKHLLDYRIRYDRRHLANETQAFSHRYTLDRIAGTLSYPLSVRSSISISPFFAQTRFSQPVFNTALTASDVVVPYGGLRTEFIFDNTENMGLNMPVGSRMKAAVEYYNGMNDGNRSFGNLTLDARHYQRIYNEIVLAVRTSYGFSFGNAAKQFLLGGMDNWINNISERTGVLDDAPGGSDGKTDWLFTQYATNMRGFNYNTMAGTSYLLFNAEFRVPVVRAFYRGAISSQFMRHLQLTAFSDAGSAWTGGNPFTTNNSINTRRFTNGPFDITVINYDSPFLFSYGLGARTMVLGYYLKLDVAQGVRNGIRQTPSFILTLGNDF